MQKALSDAKGRVMLFNRLNGDKGYIGNYKAEAVFEKDKAAVSLYIVKEDDKWKILDFMLEAKLFDEANNPSYANVKEINSPFNMAKNDLEILLYRGALFDSVQTRHYANMVYHLAKIYEEEGRNKEALALYSNVLKVDAMNFEQQIHYAGLLIEEGEDERAKNVLATINNFVKNEKLQQDIYKLISKIGMTIDDFNKQTEKLNIDKKNLTTNWSEDIIVYLIPVGDVNPFLLKELKLKLQELLKISVVIKNKKIDLKKVKTRKRKGANIQFYATDIIDELMIGFLGEQADEKMKVYIGITPGDIYGKNTNFVFGTSVANYGVISYNRFMTSINLGNESDKKKLVDRTFKQAISTINFTLGIPRCSTPFCVRSYPHSLSEHDTKGTELCDLCLKRLNSVKNRLRFPKEFKAILPCKLFSLGLKLLGRFEVAKGFSFIYKAFMLYKKNKEGPQICPLKKEVEDEDMESAEEDFKITPEILNIQLWY